MLKLSLSTDFVHAGLSLWKLPRSQENAGRAQRLEHAKIRCLLFVAAAQDGLTAGATE
jgi:hypothetical protein